MPLKRVNISVNGDMWNKALGKAEARGVPLSELLRQVILDMTQGRYPLPGWRTRVFPAAWGRSKTRVNFYVDWGAWREAYRHARSQHSTLAHWLRLGLYDIAEGVYPPSIPGRRRPMANVDAGADGPIAVPTGGAGAPQQHPNDCDCYTCNMQADRLRRQKTRRMVR